MALAFETEMGVLPEIAQAVDELEWSLPTDIQSDAIPLILGGGDVLMAAETGSGKTGAFCLPVLQIVFESKKNRGTNKKTNAGSARWKMSVYDRTPAMAVDTEGALCQSRDTTGWHSCRANMGVRSPGKYYFETEVTDDGLCRVGWSTQGAAPELGTCPYSFGYGGTGKKSNNRKFDDYGGSFTNGNKIGNCIDFFKNEIKWTKNGIDLGTAYRIPNELKNATFYPAVSLKNAEMKFIFTDGAENTAPQGYCWVSKAPSGSVEYNVKHSSELSAVQNDRKPQGPIAIIIEPSRELAEQTFKQLNLFNKYLKDPSVSTSLIVGGANTRDQLDEIRRGVDIIVATPGRLQDLVSSKSLALDNCRFYVLDECDGLLSQGHKQVIEDIHRLLPRVSPTGERLQMIVCSATLHSFEVKKLANSLMQFPQWVDLKGEDSVPDTVHHVVCVVNPKEDKDWQKDLNELRSLTDEVHKRDKQVASVESPEMMSQAIKLMKLRCVVDAIEKLKMDKALIFCRTKLDCDNLEKLFIRQGGGPAKPKHQFSCVCLHSDRNPKERKDNLERFKQDAVRFLICTDVAARGIDIKGLPYVINVTLPDEKENYVHRIGRVGRAERMGLAVSLVSLACKEKVWYHSNCPSRGRDCSNTALVDQGGCCIWYNEQKILGDIEEHLNVTIDQIDRRFDIRTNEFDGKVVYGQKAAARTASKGHTEALASTVRDLAAKEKRCQDHYLSLLCGV